MFSRTAPSAYSSLSQHGSTGWGTSIASTSNSDGYLDTISKWWGNAILAFSHTCFSPNAKRPFSSTKGWRAANIFAGLLTHPIWWIWSIIWIQNRYHESIGLSKNPYQQSPKRGDAMRDHKYMRRTLSNWAHTHPFGLSDTISDDKWMIFLVFKYTLHCEVFTARARERESIILIANWFELKLAM